MEEEEKEEEKVEDPIVEQPFQDLFVTCPDGLCITYQLESALGKIIAHIPYFGTAQYQKLSCSRRIIAHCPHTSVPATIMFS